MNSMPNLPEEEISDMEVNTEMCLCFELSNFTKTDRIKRFNIKKRYENSDSILHGAIYGNIDKIEIVSLLTYP